MIYLNEKQNPGEIGLEIRHDTAVNGQHPYSVIVTCSDSRVSPEHIFSAGIGELFVIRTAGNVIGTFELGSIEYGVEHLGAKVVVVMGHSHCGAVAAALEGGAEGNIEAIVKEIKEGIGREKDAGNAENLNIRHSVDVIMGSEIIKKLVDEKKVIVIGAKYDIYTGAVEFFKSHLLR
jgi:carbonic anhydrase